MNINKYVWNWTVVAKLAPEYKKYLEEENINHIKDDYITQIRIRAVHNTPSLRVDNLNDEEMDIVNMMSDGENNAVPTNRERCDFISERCDYCDYLEDEPKMVLKPKYLYPKAPKSWHILPIMAALPPPKTVLDVGSKMWMGKDTLYVFNSEKLERRNKNQIILVYKYKYSHTPPFIRLMKAVYRFDPLQNTMSEMKKEFRGLTYNYKTGNAYIIKNINKTKNKRYRQHLQGVLFNTQLIRTALSVPMDLTGAIQLKHRFIKKMEEEIRKRVTDLFILGPPENTCQHKSKRLKTGVSIIIDKRHLEQISAYEQETLRFLLVLLQGKLKKRFQPPSVGFIRNLYSCFEFEHIMQEGEQQAIGTPPKLTTIAKTANYKRNMTRRIFRALRKPNTKNLPKIFLKTRYKPYKALYGKLFREASYETVKTLRMIKNIMHLEEARFSESKHIYHFLSYILSLPNNQNILQRIDALLYSLINIDNDMGNSTIVNAYLKTYKRFLTNGGINIQKTSESLQESFVDWARWKDIYSMGAQLGIRIRPNKFRNTGDIDYLHDKFSEYFQRDREINRSYNGFEFLEFKSPDKEYPDSKGNKFRFIQIRNASELVEEGKSMHHCVGSYAPRCAEGTSIIFSMHNGERSYVTVELKGHSSSYELGSVYTIKNNVITNNSINEIIDEWREDCLELHKKDTISYFVMSEKLIEKFRIIKQLELQNECRAGEFGDRTEGLTKRLNELITEIQEIKKVEILATNEV